MLRPCLHSGAETNRNKAIPRRRHAVTRVRHHDGHVQPLIQIGNTVMKPWIKRTLIGLFGASILVGGLTACGHRPHALDANLSAEQVAQYRAKVLDRVSSKLDLNADQKQRLGVLADKLHEQRTALIGIEVEL